MIRVEITKTVWRTKSGAHAIGEPIFPGGEEEWQQERQTLLVQEFEDLRIDPIVALLNRLQEPPLCVCGHPEHHGRCRVLVSTSRSMWIVGYFSLNVLIKGVSSNVSPIARS